MAPLRLAHYEILERIGRGGMGVVYKARDTRLGRLVAIKLLRPEIGGDSARNARFLREARAAAALHHSNIATIFEIGEVDSDVAIEGAESIPPRTLYIAMEYVEGRDLKSILRDGPLPIDEALELGLQVARALDVAHRHGVIHRDLKPGNIRITPEGDAKLLDFGLAKMLPEKRGDDDPRTDTGQTHLTFEGTIMGTPPYIAPEQLQSVDVDARSDLFSFGVVLFEMLTGETPYLGGSVVSYVRSLVNEPRDVRALNADTPSEVADLIDGLLAQDPAARTATAHDAYEVLRAVTGGSIDSAFVTAPTAPLSTTVRRGRWSLALAAAVALAAALTAWAFDWPASWREPTFQSLAVLPFANRTGDASQDPRFEGLGFYLGKRLAEVPGLNVVDWTETRGYRRGDKSEAVIADELAVDWVLRGTVNRSPRGQTAMSVNLVGTGDRRDAHDFAGTDEALPEVVRRIALWATDQVGLDLPRKVRRRLDALPTTSDAAFTTYLLGLEAIEDKRRPHFLDGAEGLFRSAIADDPAFALAHAALSETLRRRFVDNRAQALWLSEAEDAARTAVRLDPNSPSALVALANVYRAKGEYTQAIDLLVQVLATHKNLDYAYRDLGRTYRASGDLEKARASYDKAVEIRPGYWLNWSERGAFLHRTGDYDGARRDYREAIALAEPGNVWPHNNLLMLEQQAGDLDAAKAVDEQIPRPIQDDDLASNLGTLYFYTDRLQDAVAYYQLAVRLDPNEYRHYHNLADAFEALGQDEEARAAYGQALDLLDRIAPSEGIVAALEPYRLYYQAKVNRCPDAESRIDMLASHADEEATLVASFAIARALCGDAEAAERSLRRAADLGLTEAAVQLLPGAAALRELPGFASLREAAPP